MYLGMYMNMYVWKKTMNLKKSKEGYTVGVGLEKEEEGGIDKNYNLKTKRHAFKMRALLGVPQRTRKVGSFSV